MTAQRAGKIVTFYSYKGGTGRTMALANVAWILAASGKRVLVADWDLESPGLHRYFHPFIPPYALANTRGVIDLVREFEWASAKQPGGAKDPEWLHSHATVKPYIFTMDWSGFATGGQLDFLPAGRQNNDYATTLSGLNWDDFYERLGGELFFQALRSHLVGEYDYTLIDSRTGYSDVADICTIDLPDVLVDCFTLSSQALDGASRIARQIGDRYRSIRDIRVLPVPMRIDPAEKDRADAGRAIAKQTFAGFPAGLDASARERYWAATQVPYQAYYAYEESLATFADEPGVAGSLLSAYELLTSHITNGEVRKLPDLDAVMRRQIARKFIRVPVIFEDEITLTYAPRDQIWAEWIRHVLTLADVKVNDGWAAPGSAPVISGRKVLIVSRANASVERQTRQPSAGAKADSDPLVVYIDDTEALPRVPEAHYTRIDGVAEELAIERILALIGHSDATEKAITSERPRFPATPAMVFNAPGNNPRFTGREHDIRSLRTQLSTGSPVIVSGTQAVALQGMGGIGKTQLALEYAHRFGSAYDVVWWVTAEPVTFIDAQMMDLGEQLGIQALAPGPGLLRSVRQALDKGEPYKRWLLIFDNAELPIRVRGFFPHGTGHILVTSRDPSWGDQVHSLPVDVFQRHESMDCLRTRIGSIRPEEANQVADMLGDLPIAVAGAAAYLAETGMSVADYLKQVERHGPAQLTAEPVVAVGLPATSDQAASRSVAATWDMSFELLAQRSPAAYRLLQICSVLAPEIALELIYSDELAAALIPFDSSVSEPLVRGSLIQQINRLSLLKLDPQGGQREAGEPAGQIQVHRLLQHVVRSNMSDVELADVRHQVHVVLAASRPKGEVDDPATWPRFRLLWPHLEISGAVNSDDEGVRRLLIDRVRYLYLRRDLRRGLDRAQQTESAWSARLAALTADLDAGQLRPDAAKDRSTQLRQLLHLRFNMANILRELGKFQESRHLDEEILEAQQQLLGPQHPHTLVTAGGLAADLRGLGHYREALDRDQETYQLWKDLYGDDSPRTLAALNNLAVSFRLIGEYEQALKHDEDARDGRARVLGDKHPDTLASAGSLGRDLREAGQYQRALTLLDGIAATYVNAPDLGGPDSRAAQNAKVNWAVSLRSAGDAGTAGTLLEEAYRRLSNDLPDSPDSLACRLSLAVNFLAIGDAARAEEELVAVHGAYRSNLGEQHPHTLVCVNNLAMVARAKGDVSGAHAFATEAAAKLGDVLGDDHPYTLAALTNVAVCEAERGWTEQALHTLDEIAVRLEAVLGPDHPDTLRCHANRALLRYQRDRALAPQMSVVLAQLAERVGARHPAVLALRDERLLHRIIDPHPF